MATNENNRQADKNWHNQQNQKVPDTQNTYQPGHAQNKDQLNRLTDRKDNRDIRNPKPKHSTDN